MQEKAAQVLLQVFWKATTVCPPIPTSLFFLFFTLVSLPPPPPSSSDHQGLTSTGAQSRGKTQLEKNKQTKKYIESK